MRPLKLLCLATVASLAASAFVATGSASALSTMCTETPEEKGGNLACQAGTMFEEANVMGTNDENALFSTAIGDVECPMATSGALLAQGGGKATGNASLVFKSCTTTFTGCQKVIDVTTVAPIKSELVYVKKTSPEGNLILPVPSTTIELQCNLILVQCVYGGNTGEFIAGNIYNGEQKMRITNASLKLVGKSKTCPNEATLSVAYSIKAHSGKVGGVIVGEGPFYVAKE